jgi:hypothetical protein
MTLDAVLATIVTGGRAPIQLNINAIKIFDFYINLKNQTKSFTYGFGKNMRKAACPLGSVVSLNLLC